jgi:Rrf2 family transcriptional regulator, iron-sulfur cluster assembly transcription factor
VQLELGRRADYGIRATIDLARHHPSGSRRKAREIAAAMDIPPTYIAQVLAELVRAELVTSTAGRAGGYVLARPPQEVTLLAVIVALEERPTASVCVLRGGPCRWDDICAVHLPWFEAQRAMTERLDQATLAEVIEIDELLERGESLTVARRGIRHRGSG